MNAAVQRQIVEQKIEQAEQVIYSASIDKRVADKCGDGEMAKRAVEVMTKWEKMKDKFEELLREIDNNASQAG